MQEVLIVKLTKLTAVVEVRSAVEIGIKFEDVDKSIINAREGYCKVFTASNKLGVRSYGDKIKDIESKKYDSLEAREEGLWNLCLMLKEFEENGYFTKEEKIQ